GEQEEAEILRRAKAGQRVDRDLALAICEAFAPDDEDAGVDDADANTDEEDEDEIAEDPESTAIIEGGPPSGVPPTAPNPPPTNFALQNFDRAIGSLKLLMTKPSAQFAKTSHGTDVLENVESFIHAVAKAIAKGDER